MLTRTALTELHRTAVALDAKPPWEGFLRVRVIRRYRRGRKDLAQTVITFRGHKRTDGPGFVATRELVGGEDFDLAHLIIDHPRRLDDLDPRRRESPGWLRVDVVRPYNGHRSCGLYYQCYQIDVTAPMAYNTPWSYYPPRRDVIGEPRYADWSTA